MPDPRVPIKLEAPFKDDADKPPMHFLPLMALLRVSRVFGFGASKYSSFGWRRGTKQDALRYVGASLRHLAKWQDGKTYDEESGHEHLAHALASLLMAFDLELQEEEK